jgi:hypothetical protein
MIGFELTIFDTLGAAERNDPLHPLATQSPERHRNLRDSIKISKTSRELLLVRISRLLSKRRDNAPKRYYSEARLSCSVGACFRPLTVT